MGVSGTVTTARRRPIGRKVAAWAGTRRSTLGQRKATGQVRDREKGGRTTPEGLTTAHRPPRRGVHGARTVGGRGTEPPRSGHTAGSGRSPPAAKREGRSCTTPRATCRRTGPAGGGSDLSAAPLLHTLRPRLGRIFVDLRSTPETTAHSAFFTMAVEHKKPLAGPAQVRSKSHLLRGGRHGG